MARTANVFARVEPELKEQAEDILQQLGIPMSNAVGMFLKQIVLQRVFPLKGNYLELSLYNTSLLLKNNLMQKLKKVSLT